MNIFPGYLVLVLEGRAIFEPYIPSRFARCLGYDQLYVRNPNSGLQCGGGLLDDVKAWFWNITGCTGAKF